MSDLPLFDYARSAHQSSTPRAPARHIPCSQPADSLPDDMQRIIELLRTHVGKDQGLTAARIAEDLGILPDHPRERRGDHVRRLINDHKLDLPFLIVADPSNGFYRPSGPDDVTHFHRAMRSRIREIALNLRAHRLLAIRDGFVRTGPDSWGSPSSIKD